MREGTQLGVAKAARSPPCPLPFLGRRFHYPIVFSFTPKITFIHAFSIWKKPAHRAGFM